MVDLAGQDDSFLPRSFDLEETQLEIYAAAKRHGGSEANDQLLAEFGRRFAGQGKKKASNPNP
jgi:hypothetical protein